MSLQLTTDHTGSSSSGLTKPEMNHIHVGPQKERFLIHKHLRINAFTSIRETFEKEDSKQRETGIISMPNEDPKIFSFALEWMYNAQGKELRAIKWGAVAIGDVLICFKLWLFGSRWTMPELQNAVMRQLHAWRMESAEKVLDEVVHSIASNKDVISGSGWETYGNKLVHWILDMCSHQGHFLYLLEEHGGVAGENFDHVFLYHLAVENAGSCYCDEEDPTKEVDCYLEHPCRLS